MIYKNNIPKLIVPQSSSSKNEFKISSYNLINFLNNFIIKITKYINTEKAIDEENHNYNDDYYKGVNDCFNLINYILFYKVNEKTFWKNLLSDNTCVYEHKKGKNYKKICNRAINIETLHKYGKYLCCRHIKEEYYKKKTNIISDNDRCIGINKHGKRCNITKKYGNYCFHHRKYPVIIEDITSNDLPSKNTNTELLEINKKVNIHNIRIKYTYDENKSNNIKLICFNNYKSYFDIQNIQEEGPKEEKSINKLEKESQNKESNRESIDIKKLIENCKETYNEKNYSNINITNLKYKVDIIKEILNITSTCNVRNCEYMNTIYIAKTLYCHQHASHVKSHKSYLFNHTTI